MAMKRIGPATPPMTTCGASSAASSPSRKRSIRRLNAVYYGICTFLDQQIGQVLAEMDALNLRDSTRIIYTSDHGEHIGARGIYGKFTMYEEACNIPFIMVGTRCADGAKSLTRRYR